MKPVNNDKLSVKKSHMDLSAIAIEYVKSHKKEIVDKFANVEKYPPVENPFTIFMAGAPGAGKTEFSMSFDPQTYSYKTSVPYVRIDADEIRKMMPGYDGKIAYEFQAGATIGIEKLFDHANKNDQNILLDTTFSDLAKAQMNVERSLKHKRKVGIFYIHLDPKIAWAYTQIREQKEGRRVSKEFFVESYFNSREVVNKIKKNYPAIELNVILKEVSDDKNKQIQITSFFKIPNIDNYVRLEYTRHSLLTTIDKVMNMSVS